MVAVVAVRVLTKNSMPKQRLDVLVVQLGLCDSREQAQRLILAGEVSVKDQVITKSGTKVDDSLPVTIKNKPKFVSRGGLKMEGALEAFPVSPEGKVCLDIGSSTGGFTDCLLQNGALRVHAIDVGTNQMVWKLRSDPRVILKEQFNARYLTLADLGEPAELIVSDVSFISLTKILPAAQACLAEGGNIIVLIKPQFELQPEDIGQGGIVRDPELHERSIQKIKTFVTEELGMTWMGLADSPIKGMEGNKEFLAWFR